MRLRLLYLLALALAVGCARHTHKLDGRWEPLHEVAEAGDELIAPGVTTTVGHSCFVADLDSWLLRHPPGTIEYDAVLLHEQIHSRRQLDYELGLAAWLARYLADPEFRWEEEKLGYEAAITHLVQNGRQVNTEHLALILNKNYDFNGRMVSYADALEWVRGIVARAQH